MFNGDTIAEDVAELESWNDLHYPISCILPGMHQDSAVINLIFHAPSTSIGVGSANMT
jgi:hypothetical protein